MPTLNVTIRRTARGSQIQGETLFHVYHLDIPIPPDDLHTLFIAAAKNPDEHPRTELAGVIGDRTPEGVRVREVANSSHFDIPWQTIMRGIELK